MSNDKADATFHPDKPLPSLDFVKPVGHEGEHLPVRNPAVVPDLTADPERSQFADTTAIYCRALKDGHWHSLDIAELDRASLIEFIGSRGPVNNWARDIILILLGHSREGLS